MKTIKYILYALTATFVLASCSDDIKYTPGEGEDTDCYGVYFPSQENAGDQELDPAEPTTLTFTAMRKNYNDAITVPVEVSSTQDGLFTVSEIKFEAGQEATTFSVDFPGAEVGKTYDCSIVVKDKKYALLYGEYSNGLDFSVTRVQWDLVKGPNGETKGTWRDDFFTAIMGSNIKENGVPNAEKEVEASLLRKKAHEELAKRDSFPKKDYTDKNARAAELEAIAGHPLYTLTKENDALTDLLARFKEGKDESLIPAIRDLSIHYAKKGDMLYPLLKVKYGVSGPSDVMWTVDDEIRDELSALAKENDHGAEWSARLDAVLTRAEEMIYKEQNILFPICAVNFTEEEWYGIYHDEKDYDLCFGVEQERWETAEGRKVSTVFDAVGEIVMPGGHMTVEQLTALLNTIPMEITFVDADNINRFFNEGPKVFKRPGMAIDREVFSCHPPKIEPMVRQIIDDFRNNRRDEVPVWMEKGGRTMLVKYMAVRDNSGAYLGTVELVQDMEFAKTFFLGENK